MLITRTPVRISFAGGGTDLPTYYREHGGIVLSTTINKYFFTILTERQDRLTQVISADLRAIESYEEISQGEFPDCELEIPFAALRFVRFPGGANLFLASEIPPGTGLGSSAAVCVNLLRILQAYLRLSWTRAELAENAFRIAREMLRRPVGKQDEYAAAFGGINLIHFSADKVSVEPQRWPQDLVSALEQRLMLFLTGMRHDSMEILTEQDRPSPRREAEVVRILSELKSLVIPMRDALQMADFKEFGRLLHEAWEIKKGVSGKITNSQIDELYALARAQGADGGKITGAGGGGCLLLCCEPEKQAHVREALVARGCFQLFFHLETAGSHIVFDDPFFDSAQQGGIHWRFWRPPWLDKRETEKPASR